MFMAITEKQNQLNLLIEFIGTNIFFDNTFVKEFIFLDT